MESHGMHSSSGIEIGEGQEAKWKYTTKVETIQYQVKC